MAIVVKYEIFLNLNQRENVQSPLERESYFLAHDYNFYKHMQQSK